MALLAVMHALLGRGAVRERQAFGIAGRLKVDALERGVQTDLFHSPRALAGPTHWGGAIRHLQRLGTSPVFCVAGSPTGQKVAKAYLLHDFACRPARKEFVILREKIIVQSM